MFEKYTNNNNSFTDSFRQEFHKKDMLSRLISINVFVFLFLLATGVFFFLSGKENYFVPLLSVPADLDSLALRPWGAITYMFTHRGFFHLLFNMIFLFWASKLFLQYFSQEKLLYLYLAGGLGGAALYIAAFNLLPAFSSSLAGGYTIGASAAVIAIFFGVAFYEPNRRISLIFFGRVKLYYVALFFIILDLLRIPESNAGGHISHLGGAIIGFLFALIMQQSIGNRKTFQHKQAYKKNKEYAYNSQRKEKEEDINVILDKISKSGYESLSAKERKTLFKSSYKK